MPFDEPKVELEQYPTGAHIAARMVFTVRFIQARLHVDHVVYA